MIIYNLFPLLAGKLTIWEKHLVRASKMGFNWIFINPIQATGKSGSLYAITDYFRFNPLLIDTEGQKAPEDQIREVTERAEELGLRMMIDLVANHCSADSDLIKQYPQWFLWERAGQVAHPFAYEDSKKIVWYDLAKFDHQNTPDPEGLFQFFFKVVNYLSELGFKGFRCDAAYQVPAGFWRRLIGETKAMHPEALFFAETLGCPVEDTMEMARAGFDYIFNSSIWWDFRGHWLMEQYQLTRQSALSVSFPESHDTLRLCEELQGNVEGLKQRYLFSALFSAGVMIPIGFEFGFRKRLAVVETRPEHWEDTDIDLTRYITRVNRIKDRFAIFKEEAPTQLISNGNPNILILWRGSTSTPEESLLILNKDTHNKQEFYAGNLQEFVQGRAPLVDVSPEHPLDYIPTPFSYELRPGQGIVLVTKRSPSAEQYSMRNQNDVVRSFHL
jgi:starch synthase (maltosyl-transferring)